MRLVSQALLDTLMLSSPCSFLAGCPKTWLRRVRHGIYFDSQCGGAHRYLEALTKRDISQEVPGEDGRQLLLRRAAERQMSISVGTLDTAI